MNKPIQIVGVFGLPCSGKGSVLSELHRRSVGRKKEIHIISVSALVKKLLTPESAAAMKKGGLFPHEEPLRALLSEKIEEAAATESPIVMIDGFPRFDEQLEWLRENFEAFHHMALVKIDAAKSLLAQRATARARDEFDTDPKKLKGRLIEQEARINGMEASIRKIPILYFTVQNDGTTAQAATVMSHYLRKGGFTI
jgi:adenylate kinase family enzyme